MTSNSTLSSAAKLDDIPHRVPSQNMGMKLDVVFFRQLTRALQDTMETPGGRSGLLPNFFDELRHVVDLLRPKPCEARNCFVSRSPAPAPAPGMRARSRHWHAELLLNIGTPPDLIRLWSRSCGKRRGVARPRLSVPTRSGKQMVRQIEGIGDHSRNHGARNDRCDQRRVLALIDNAM